MELGDRLYWFGRNLIAFVLVLFVSPIHFLWVLLGTFVTLTVTDGSEIIAWPWDWEWR